MAEKLRKDIRLISAILCILLIFLFTGCKNKKTEELNNRQVSPTPAAEQNSETMADKTESTLQKDDLESRHTDNNNDISDFTGEPQLEDFTVMDDHIIDYKFEISYEENADDYEITYTIHGEYDLNGDGNSESIDALLKAYGEDGSYLKVDGIEVPLYLSNPAGEIYIIDIDGKDKYKEIAVYDLGPSADPVFDFYRYDGSELAYLFSIDRGALMDGQGKFISSFHITTRFNPKFYSAWGEYKDGKYTITNKDISQYIGKTFEFDGMAYFVPMDEKPENYFEHVIWDYEAQKDFETTKIKFLDIHIDKDDPILNWFFVEMPDGEKGLLYFWIGD